VLISSPEALTAYGAKELFKSFLFSIACTSLGGTALRFRGCNLAQFRRCIMEERFTYHTRRASTEGTRDVLLNWA